MLQMGFSENEVDHGEANINACVWCTQHQHQKAQNTEEQVFTHHG